MSERRASDFRKGQFTNPHLKVLQTLSNYGIYYRAEEVVHCWGEFDGMGRPISCKVDVLIVDARYGAGIIEVDGNSHSSLRQSEKDEKRDERLTKLGFWIERVPNADVKNVMIYLEKHRK